MSQASFSSKIISWLAVILWMGLIFYLSHQPASVSSEISSGLLTYIMDFIENRTPFVMADNETVHYFFRKGAHFSAYFMLGILSLIALEKNYPHPMKAGIGAFLICVLYAMSDEVHQLFIPGRSGEVKDVLIDGTGSFVGISVYLLVNRLVRRLGKD